MNPEPNFAKYENGLFPIVIQDHKTREVLTQAYVDREAWALILQTRMTHTYSRERKGVFKKGATSGHTQLIMKITLDCDCDCALLEVRRAGAACHIDGHDSCFHNPVPLETSVP